MSYAWGGFQNGQIPSSAMAIIPGTAQFIKRELLPGVVALRAAFRAQFGYDLEIVEAYRPLPTQQYLYNGWVARKPGFNLAAYPGTSMHGWGLSIDFGSRVNVYGSAEKTWMDANAPRYGFQPTGNGFSPREAWHFDGTGTTTAGGNATEIQTPQELFMEDSTFKSDSNATVYLYIVATGGVRTLTGPEYTMLQNANPGMKTPVLSVAQTSAIVNGHLVDRVKGR